MLRSLAMIVEAPSGLTVEMSPMKGRDIQVVADALEGGQNISEKAMCQLLRSCWTSTVDVGPYAFGVEAPPNYYAEVLKGDIVPLLLGLRCGSFEEGRRYSFQHRCEDPECRTRFTWDIDLERDVLARRKKLSLQGVAYVKEGKLVEVERAGRKWGFKLMRLVDEEPMMKFIKQTIKRGKRKSKSIQVYDMLAGQLVEIDGEPEKNIRTRWETLADLRMEDLLRIREDLEMHDIDVDTTITVVCPECGLEQDVILPLGKDFLVPANPSSREKRFGKVGEAEAEA